VGRWVDVAGRWADWVVLRARGRSSDGVVVVDAGGRCCEVELAVHSRRWVVAVALWTGAMGADEVNVGVDSENPQMNNVRVMSLGVAVVEVVVVAMPHHLGPQAAHQRPGLPTYQPH